MNQLHIRISLIFLAIILSITLVILVVFEPIPYFPIPSAPYPKTMQDIKTPPQLQVYSHDVKG